METIVFDFSRVILFPKDQNYQGGLNKLHKDLSVKSDYKFLDNFKFNDELIKYLKLNKEKFELYIFTTGNIQNTPEVQRKIKGIFNKIYTVTDLGLGKESSKTFNILAQKIGKKPEDILFIDDTLQNVEAAKKAGLKTIQYNKDNKKLIQILERFSYDLEV